MQREVNTVVVADDHELFREALRADLEYCGFAVAAEAGDALDAVRAVLEERPDIVLLDVQMPGDGINAAHAIASELPGTKIVMLTASRDEDVARAALRAGASGYLLKDVDSDRLADALRRVAGGELCFPARLFRRALDELRRDSRGAQLESDDWQIAELVGEGLSAAQIAERLSLATHVVRERTAAVAAAFRDSAATPAPAQ